MLYFNIVLISLVSVCIQSQAAQAVNMLNLSLIRPNQTIFQKYQGINADYWLTLVQQNGVMKLKRYYYYTKYFLMYPQTHYLDKDHKFHAAEPFTFNYFLISDSSQTQFWTYQWYQNANDYTYPGISHTYLQYIVDSKFTTHKFQVKRISSQFGEVQLDNLITYDGWNAYMHDQWINIVSIDYFFFVVFSQNGLFCYDQDSNAFLKCYQHQIYGYQCDTYYSYYSSTIQQQTYPWQRYAAFCWKQFKNQTHSGVQYLIRILGTNQQPFNWILIQQFKGQVLDIIEFKISSNQRRFFMKYTDFDNKTKYIGKYCNYQNFQVLDIIITPQILNFQITFQISSFHFYARNISIGSQSSLWHSYYYFSSNQLIIVSQQQLKTAQIQYWTNSIISQTSFDQAYQLNSVPFLNHYYQNDRSYYFYQQTGIDMREQQQKAYEFVFNGEQYFDPYNQLSFRYSDNYFNKKTQAIEWLYSYWSISGANYTYFSYLTYPQSEYTLALKNRYRVLSVTEGSIDCILTYKDIGAFFMILKFNRQTNKFQNIYEKNLKLVLSGYQSAKVGNQCVAFSIDNIVFRQKRDNKSAIFYANDTIAYKWESASFDNNFQFAVSGNNLYKYVNETYTSIVQYPFSSQNIVSVNENKSRITVLANQQTVNQNGIYIHVFYHVKLAVFFLDLTGKWKNIDTGIQFQSTQSVDKIYIDPYFEIMCFSVYNLSGTISIFLRLDYSSGTAQNLTDSSKILASIYKGYTASTITSNYAYMTNSSHQFIFKLNRELSNYQMVVSNEVDSQYFANPENMRLIQSENQAYILYCNTYTPQIFRSTVTVTRRNISLSLANYHIQARQRGILLNHGVYLCPPACAYCFNEYICRKCSNGYAMNFNNKRCLKCESNCMTCNFTSLYTCFTCFPGYYLRKGGCESCHQSCFQCSSKTQNNCISCYQGYTLTVVSFVSKKCIKCPQNCKNCTNQTSCNDCQYGYTVTSDGKCLKCGFDCNKCNSSQLTSCIDCKHGFYSEKLVNLIQNITCIRCLKNCKRCQSKELCLQCDDGFIWINSMIQVVINSTNNSITNGSTPTPTIKIINKCILPCQLPCKTCLQGNQSVCTSCIEGYYYNESIKVCEQLSICKDTASCITCPYNYNLILNRCYLCGNVSQCTSCYKYNFEICLSCQKGFYLDLGTCKICNNQCQQCILSDVCTKCKPGFMKSINFFSKFPKCIPCSSNCLTCIYSTSNCLTCKQNQYLQGTVCLSRFQIVFIITINFDFQALNNSMIEDLKKLILSLTGKKSSDLNFISIRSGSTIISGTIKITDDADQYKTMGVLEQQFAGGKSIGQNVVLASSFEGTFQSQNLIVSNQSSISLGLLLGIVLPASIVFIAIILAISFSIRRYLKAQQKKKKQMQNSIYNTQKSQQQRNTRRRNRASRKIALFLPSITLSRLSTASELESVSV